MPYVEVAWLTLLCFGLTIISSLVPWVNAEVILLSFVAAAPSSATVVTFVAAATAGQMVGKCVLFWTSRHTLRSRSGRLGQSLDRMIQKLADRPLRTIALVFVSSVAGIPPFYLVTIAAGALHMNFVLYCAAGGVGRLARFSAVALATRMVVNAPA